MACLLACIIVLFGCVSATNLISFEPIDDSAGLVFERVGALRHVTEQRFLFVQTIDYDPLLQELTKISDFVRDTRDNATGCPLLKLIKPGKPRATIFRINKHLASLTQINNEFVSYALNSADPINNEVEIEFDYVDTRQQDTAFADAHNPPHWSTVGAADIKALLAAPPPRDHAKVLPRISTANVTDKYLEYEACMDANRSAENECLYLTEMHNAMSRKLTDAASFAYTLDRLIKQTRRNKLNTTNNVLDDGALLREMRQLIKVLAARNLSWVVNFEREMNARFDLSQAYKLHLYANKNTRVLCIAMPLVDTTALQYNLYRVGTGPFFRGTMCLMMVPAASHVAVTDTRNFYTQVPVEFTTQCQHFSGYNEFLCPASPRVATFNSGVCEIEMFMGRHANNFDSLCDVRVADNNAKQVLLGILVNNRKWIYAFSSSATINYSCDGHYDAVVNVPAGVGVITAQSLLICSVRVNRGALVFNVDTRSYVTDSRSYWPRHRFNYNDYVDASLLMQTSTPFANAVADLSVQQLQTLRSRFYIRDYTAPPKSFFSPRRNDVDSPELPVPNEHNIIDLVSVLVGMGAVSVLCAIGAYCAFKRHRMHKRCSVVVSFSNDDHQPMVAISNSARANIHLPQNNAPKYEKAFLFPMEIERTNNKLV
ncbi:fusion protein [Choristoneura fumiferana multiple nucleopolyhedrovirus]|uniref:Fusion protein n=1 Tax=Choristoneura fumiferana nuclear polyhedrosis virus TaxID=208973 RepID=Q7TLW5_NPVCF|nr:fusion protein [Choristoneura fumiferana multiple nucleopolyhedrovirus]AAP29812.3 fusion protein [Choristoneura fumiferana multiple nucleopolyhedrovirus]